MDATARKPTDGGPPVYLMDEVVRLKNQASPGGWTLSIWESGTRLSHPASHPDRSPCGSRERSQPPLFLVPRPCHARRAFADWYQDRFGVVLDPDNEVLPLDRLQGRHRPCSLGLRERVTRSHPRSRLPTYQGGTILAGGTPRYYPCVPKQVASRPWRAGTAKPLTRQVDAHHYPSNRHGIRRSGVFRRGAAFGLRHNIIICHDNAYPRSISRRPAASSSRRKTARRSDRVSTPSPRPTS